MAKILCGRWGTISRGWSCRRVQGHSSRKWESWKQEAGFWQLVPCSFSHVLAAVKLGIVRLESFCLSEGNYLYTWDNFLDNLGQSESEQKVLNFLLVTLTLQQGVCGVGVGGDKEPWPEAPPNCAFQYCPAPREEPSLQSISSRWREEFAYFFKFQYIEALYVYKIQLNQITRIRKGGKNIQNTNPHIIIINNYNNYYYYK